ncbi:transhydrogenase, putative [Eimeria maxima]|uniref:proton-translocating NAD(P)(+) transhydrogenase n=1 Tax=Eimeria maxima TaxID=5804 RepID=U6MJ04_EIMMA|nr:transhydrogenase, putative [Eimeria maxima]CDJ61620.1 transhydrogenase, putative [Eimeria maxima]
MWRPSGLSSVFLAACLGLALFATTTNAEFDFPAANLRSIQRHLVRMGEFFPVNRPGEGDEGFDGARPENPEGGAISKFAFSNMPSLLGAVYLFSAVCFILCLRGLSTPQTAKRGNILGLVGMVAAVVVTFTEAGFGQHYLLFFATAAPAVGLGLYIAQSVNMTEMPQLVALFHSFVGLAAVMVGFANFHSPAGVERASSLLRLLEVYAGVFVAGITFTGSVVAAAKLHGSMESRSLRVPGRHALNSATIAAIGVLGALFCVSSGHLTRMLCLYVNAGLSMWLGFHLVAAIGGADMPVVISLLNSYSGVALAASGFMLDNNLLIIAGALIASSGAILSYIMCRGMNRSLWNVVLGGFEEAEGVGAAAPQGAVQQTTADEVADELLAARKVLIVPGYGMAVARCQSELADIAKNLINCGITVDFGIHPVAGRMPGHMNVLLAEADVPYKIVKEMSEVNPEISSYDVVLVVGANDTVNPAALEPGSKISGMPVIEAWKARRVFVLKRSMAAGYASIENPLFHLENTRMLFGNAKNTTSAVFARVNAKAEQMPPSAARDDLESGLLEFEREERVDQSSWPYPRLGVGVLKDTNGSVMVPLAPKFVPKLRRMAFRVIVESGAGVDAGFSDEEYRRNGAEIEHNAEGVIRAAEVLLRVSAPTPEMVSRMPRDKVLISYLFPSVNTQALDMLARQGVTALAVDEVPRVTRAQKLDVKSAMQGLQGYRAVIEAFNALPKLSKASISAAGRVDAAKVFVIGAGVAGLQAISTAHGLGAQVFGHDVRSATREEVESCGGKFIGLRMGEEAEVLGGYAREMGESYQRAQRELIANTIKHCDVVICTAAIHGKPSPKLISRDMLRTMKPGSVIVDLATEFGDVRAGWGGNVEVAPKDDQIVVDGITVIGRRRIETRMPVQASELFSMNMCNLLEDLGGGSNFRVNMDDEVIRGLVAVYQGRNVWQPPQPTPVSRTPPRSMQMPPAPSAGAAPARIGGAFAQALASDAFFAMCLVVAAAVVGLLGIVLDPMELKHLTLLALSLIVGYYCVWAVTPALHTPLMSVTNALSGVIVIGCMLEYGTALISGFTLLAIIGTFLASVNIAGGFFVTHRMLKMFQI